MEMNLKFILVIIAILNSSYSFSVESDQIECAHSLEDFLIMELVNDIENLSRFNAKDAAIKMVLNQCQTELDKGNDAIRIKNGKLRFSEFSDQYNVQDPVFFCKNNSGHRAHVSQITQKIIQFSREKERAKRERALRDSPPQERPRTVNRVPPKNKKEKMWSCNIPNYIKTRKIVNKSMMETLVIAHGAGSCRLMN